MLATALGGLKRFGGRLEKKMRKKLTPLEWIPSAIVVARALVPSVIYVSPCESSFIKTWFKESFINRDTLISLSEWAIVLYSVLKLYGKMDCALFTLLPNILSILIIFWYYYINDVDANMYIMKAIFNTNCKKQYRRNKSYITVIMNTFQ